MGAFTPAGPDLRTSYDNIAAGNNYVVDVSEKMHAGYPLYEDEGNREWFALAATIQDLSPLKALKSLYRARDMKPSLIHNSADMVVQASIEAGQQAGIFLGLDNLGEIRVHPGIGLSDRRFGMRVGTGIGGATVLTDAKDKMRAGKELGPFPIFEALPGRVASVAATAFEARGDVAGVLGECAASLMAIREGAKLINGGYADVVLAGGTEGPLVDVSLGMFGGTTGLAKTKDFNRAPIPFDSEPSGVVLGDGAAMVTLMSLEYARRIGATPLAEIVGHDSSMDASREAFPDGPHAMNTMRSALEMARRVVSIEQLKILAHATSTDADVKEAIGINLAYRDVEIVGVKGLKDQIGHSGGAAGAMAFTHGIESNLRGEILGSPKLRTPIEEAYWNMPRKTIALPNYLGGTAFHAFGFGGYNCVIITVPVTDY
jgi:3-oxoacyl-[acyl-carrier-protein] synthase II